MIGLTPPADPFFPSDFKSAMLWLRGNVRFGIDLKPTVVLFYFPDFKSRMICLRGNVRFRSN